MRQRRQPNETAGIGDAASACPVDDSGHGRTGTAGCKGHCGTENAEAAGLIPNGTCILVSSEGGEWTCVQYNNRMGYCKSSFLIFLREADTGLLEYKGLRKGDKGEDVLAVK